MPYVGEQPDCPTAAGAFVQVRDGIQVYRGLPPKPYEIVGHAILSGDGAGRDAQLKWTVQNQKADAVILVDAQTHLSGIYNTIHATQVRTGPVTTTTGTGFSIPINSADETFILIRWR